MENNVQDKKETENQEQNQYEEQDNNYEEENGEEELGEEEMNLNYNQEYEGDLEGEEEGMEENMEEAQNDIEGEEMEENQEQENNEEHQVEEDLNQMNNQNQENQYLNNKDNGENENNINNKNENEINNNINKEENKIENIDNKNDKEININFDNLNNKKNNINNINNTINNNINNKLSNLQRIELINDKLNMNLNKIQKKTKPKKENIIENEIEKEKAEYKNTISRRKNDILSEVLIKIQDFKQRKENFDNIRDKYNSNQILDNLDKEITKGLERLSNRRIIQEEKNIDVNTPNNVEKKILRNPKFKDIMTMINEKDGRKYRRYNNVLGKNDLLNIVNNKRRNDIFGNINLFSQKRTNISNNSFQNNPLKKYGPDSNKIYVSCIDGKAIINGMRKEIPIVSKFNNVNYRLNNYNNMLDDYKKINLTIDNFNMTRKRNNNLNFQNKFGIKEGKNSRKLNLNIGRDDININNTLKSNFLNDNWNKDNNYFKGGLKYFK